MSRRASGVGRTGRSTAQRKAAPLVVRDYGARLWPIMSARKVLGYREIASSSRSEIKAMRKLLTLIHAHQELKFPEFPEGDDFADWGADLAELDGYYVGLAVSASGGGRFAPVEDSDLDALSNRLDEFVDLTSGGSDQCRRIPPVRVYEPRSSLPDPRRRLPSVVGAKVGLARISHQGYRKRLPPLA